MKKISTPIKIPLYYVRGGTSTGIVLLQKHLPEEKEVKEEIIRHIMGVPLDGAIKNNKQLHGLGREKTTSNKVFIIDIDYQSKKVISTFAQLEKDSNTVSWDINCGNMTSSIPLVIRDLLEDKLLMPDGKLNIYNTNTHKNILCTMPDVSPKYQLTDMPGVIGDFPEVNVSFKDPACSKTKSLFPTGNLIDSFNNILITCIDVVVPMIIINAESLGITGYENAYEIENNKALQDKIMEVRLSMGVKMGITKKDGTVMSETDLKQSITQPKIAIISPPLDRGDINIRYLTPKSVHSSIAVSGGCCLAAACCFSGTVASHIYHSYNDNSIVNIEHLSGISEFSITRNGKHIEYTGVQRNAQILMKGEFFIYNPSLELDSAMRNFT
ncbi:PrpF domain-containing protein [Xenorhabdus miraniensis]|uniref:4-oxalomesaconate tautomerase n=1 Tax=Xenorhabdus miraniensis TaxID=351674 RepID=A0A2D0JK56_9GAMM|nr:PrpF domain-containing protein [Xenorhabdus miraniensis]PHM46683.1 4-oxalomesaconate tautomerase [Xenorhabdus miraniensis]